jgi:hypothetical protein
LCNTSAAGMMRPGVVFQVDFIQIHINVRPSSASWGVLGCRWNIPCTGPPAERQRGRYPLKAESAQGGFWRPLSNTYPETMETV